MELFSNHLSSAENYMDVKLKSFKYDELELDALEKEIEENGMLFVHLSRSHARAYITYLNNLLPIEQSKRYGHSRSRIIFHLLYGFLVIIRLTFFHSKLFELDSARIFKELRCTWDIEDNGLYRFTLS
jgi:hypothetical protein